MLGKILSVIFGSSVGFIASLMNDKFFQALVLAFVGGFIGWWGGKFAKYVNEKYRCFFKKNKNG